LFRSEVGEQDAAKRLLREMHAGSLAAYQQVMTAPDTPARAEMIGALLIGVTLSRYVLGAGLLATMPRDELIDRLTRTLCGRSSSTDTGSGQLAERTPALGVKIGGWCPLMR
jgi:hypothetical protein